MSCARGAFETSIGAVGNVDNFGYIAPYSGRSSANPQYGRLRAGMLTESFPPTPEFNKSVSGKYTCKDRMTCGYANDFDGEFVEQLDEMDPGDKAAITQQSQENDDGTVSVETSENPPETIKEQESFIYGGNLRHFQGGKFRVQNGGAVNVAKSKRSNMHTERYTELSGFRDSNMLSREQFLNTKEEQEQSNATSLVILTVCFFFITLAVIWTTFGCKCCNKPSGMAGGYDSHYVPKPVYKPKASLSGGSSSGKLTGSIF